MFFLLFFYLAESKYENIRKCPIENEITTIADHVIVAFCRQHLIKYRERAYQAMITLILNGAQHVHATHASNRALDIHINKISSHIHFLRFSCQLTVHCVSEA